MKNFTLYFFLFLGLTGFAQDYATPGSGVNWTLDDLLQNSPSTVSFADGVYTLSENLTVSENDTLTFNSALILNIDADIRVTVDGWFFSQTNEENPIIITATDSLTPYEGFRFEESSEIYIDHTTIKNGGGLKVITPNFTLTNSTIAYNVSGVSTGAAVSLSNGSPLIENNNFLENDLPAVSSGANSQVSAQIINNYLEKNGQANENRPQINMGTTGSDTLKIIGNTVLGDRDMTQVGGIAVANLIGGQIVAKINNNTITDNRYGMTVAGGNAYVEITGNTIEDNDTQGDPNLGGSGISVNSSNDTQTIIASGNAFRRNLWGITVIGEASINLGDGTDNPGNNVFSENENSGETYALYNNTPNTIMAKNNCWIEGQENTLDDAAAVIFDQADDPSLGEVLYDPVNCSLSTPKITKTPIEIYPNPAKNQIHFTTAENFQQVSIFSLRGRLVVQKKLTPNQKTLNFNLDPGLYLLRFENGNKKATKKLVIAP